MSSKLLRFDSGAQDLDVQVEPLHHALNAGPVVGSPSDRSAAARRDDDRYESGVTAGRLAAEAECAARIDALEGRLGRILEDFSAVERRIHAEIEQDLIDLALTVARRVLHREVSADPDTVGALARAAMDRMAQRSLRRVRMHPAHREVIAAIVEKRCAPGSVELVVDPSLEPGDLIFEAERGSLDASVDSQLDEIRRGLADRGDRSR